MRLLFAKVNNPKVSAILQVAETLYALLLSSDETGHFCAQKM
jgi:hypothetical protein